MAAEDYFPACAYYDEYDEAWPWEAGEPGNCGSVPKHCGPGGSAYYDKFENVLVIAETRKAFLFQMEGTRCWIPKSVCDHHPPNLFVKKSFTIKSIEEER